MTITDKIKAATEKAKNLADQAMDAAGHAVDTAKHAVTDAANSVASNPVVTDVTKRAGAVTDAVVQGTKNIVNDVADAITQDKKDT